MWISAPERHSALFLKAEGKSEGVHTVSQLDCRRVNLLPLCGNNRHTSPIVEQRVQLENSSDCSDPETLIVPDVFINTYVPFRQRCGRLCCLQCLYLLVFLLCSIYQWCMCVIVLVKMLFSFVCLHKIRSTSCCSYSRRGNAFSLLSLFNQDRDVL